MSGNGDAVPIISSDETEVTDPPESLFASKGRAVPAPAKGIRPAIFLVEDETSAISVHDRGQTGDDEKSAARFDPEKDGAGDGLNKKAGKIGGSLAPAASLDAEPFDPANKKQVLFEDFPVSALPNTGDDGEQAQDAEDAISAMTASPSVTASTRPRLLTATLVGAASIAAVAAVVTALNWYDFAKQPVSDPATPGVASASAPAAASDETIARLAPPTHASASATPAGTATDSGMPVPNEPAATQPAASGSPRPTIDLVRLEPDGSTIIAGRAAPGTALIVLDNDSAIGNVVAGESGDWMLVPDRPLAGGEHEIALAIRAGDGTISVSAPQASTQATPTPRPAPETSYVVQVASVKSEAGAVQEWGKLQASLPNLLGKLDPHIDAAELRGRGTFHRIRLGPFGDREKARSLCAALTKAGKDCLVLRR